MRSKGVHPCQCNASATGCSRRRRRWWSERRPVRRPRPARQPRVEPPRGAAHGGGPADRQHGRLRVREPRRPDTVTLVSSWIPFEEPAGGPNFYLWAEHTNYDINIGNDGGTNADITYRWKFTTHYRNPNTFLYNTGPVTSLDDPDLNIYQTYDLWKIANGHKTRLARTTRRWRRATSGAASMPNYNGDLFDAATTRFGASNASYSWVGQSDDPFFLDLRVFDLLYGANLSEAGDDTLAGFNVNTFALQVPTKDVTKGSESTIGIWSTASRPSMRVENGDGSQSFQGKNVQVSRLGNPLVNEVVVPVGLKDYFNSSKPKADGAALPLVQDPELPHLLNAVYGTDVPDSDAEHAGHPAGGPDPGLPDGRRRR